MAQWDNYSTKAAPADSDTMMIKDNAATGKPNKRVPFSGLWDWIVSKLHALTSSSATLTPATDRIIMDKNGTMSRVEPSAAAKYAIETYNGTTLAGVAQSPKAAIDALNSKTALFASGINAANDDANTFINNGLYYVTRFASNLPAEHFGIILVAGLSAARIVQIFFDSVDWTIYMRFYNSGESTPFTAWHQITSA